MRTVHQVSAYLRTRIDGERRNFATVDAMILAYSDATGYPVMDIRCVNGKIILWPLYGGIEKYLGTCISVHRRDDGRIVTFRESKSHPYRTRTLRAPTMGPHKPN